MECGNALTGTLQKAGQKSKGESNPGPGSHLALSKWKLLESSVKLQCLDRVGKFINVKAYFLFVCLISVEASTSNCAFSIFVSVRKRH